MDTRSGKKQNIVLAVLSVFYGCAAVFGVQAERSGELALTDVHTYLALAGAVFAAAVVLYLLWNLFMRRRERREGAPAVKQKAAGGAGPTGKVLPALVLWILYFIQFLGVYPGFFVYDAHDELLETITRSFSNQHPLLHVLSMGAVIQGVHKLTGNYNLAIAAFILLHMTGMALIFGWIIRKLAGSKAGAAAMILYFGLFPVHVMYALCSVKDGAFSALLSVTVILLVNFLNGENNSLRETAALAAAATVMMLLRNNGVYAYAVFWILVIFAELVCTAKRRPQKALSAEMGAQEEPDSLPKGVLLTRLGKKCVLFLLPILLYMTVNHALLAAFHAEDVGHREILAVPIQQMTRVYAYDGASMTEQETAQLAKYLPAERMRLYNPKCADPVKIGFDEQAYQEDSAGFWKLYLQLGKEHPLAYLNAWVMTSYGMWYPGAVIDGYRGNTVFTYTYGDSSYFGYETEKPGDRRSLLPAVDRFYRWLSLDPAIQRMPVVHLFFSPGFVVWVFLFLMGYFVYSGQGKRAVPFGLPLLVWMTFLLGPMSLVRYVYYLWILVPVMTAL